MYTSDITKKSAKLSTDATYARPVSLAEALHLRAAGARVAAGCTDLFPATDRLSLTGDILDITGIAALSGVSRTEAGIDIGAATTWTDIVSADLPPAFDGVKQAAKEVGALQIQNQGTLGGNLCNASPAADGVPALLTLDAEVRLASNTAERQIPLQEFVLGPRKTALHTDEILTAIHIPNAALTGQGAFCKLGARAHLVISIAMVAARVEVTGNTVTQAALAIGACGPVATRLPKVEAALIGKPWDPSVVTDALVAAYLSPISDVRADAAYRSASAAELVRRCLAQAGSA